MKEDLLKAKTSLKTGGVTELLFTTLVVSTNLK